MKTILRHYFSLPQDRTAIFTAGSFFINLFVGIGQLGVGLYTMSGWIIVNASYFLLLCMARGYTVWRYVRIRRKHKSIDALKYEQSVYGLGGAFMCLTGVIYFVICLWMLLGNEVVKYPGAGLLLYAAAAVAYTKVGFSIRGIVMARHLKTPIFSVMKMVNIVDAMVSLVIAQCTLFFGQESEFAILSSKELGLGFSFVIIGIGISMLRKHYALTRHHL